MIEVYENVFVTDVDGDDENYYLFVKSITSDNRADFREDSDERKAILFLDHYYPLNFEPNLMLECAMFFIMRGLDADKKVFIVTEDEFDNCLKLGFLFEICLNRYGADEIESRFFDFYKRLDVLPSGTYKEFVSANNRLGGSLWRT